MDDFQYSGFWRRFFAFLIDFIILLILFGELVEEDWLFSIFAFIGSWLYFAFLESSRLQGTIGKKILGVRVVDQYGFRISFGRATVRYFSKILSGILLIGYIMIAVTKRKQGLHDFIAGTVLIKN